MTGECVGTMVGVPASAGMTGVSAQESPGTVRENDGVLNGVLCFSLGSRLRGNDGGGWGHPPRSLRFWPLSPSP